MGFTYKELQLCALLNRVFLAYFVNICENEGIDFEDSKPTFPQIASYNNDLYFTEQDELPGLKYFYHGKICFDDLDITKLQTQHIEDFFDDAMKSEISMLAKHFATVVKLHKHCDFVFSELPDFPPFISDFCHDPEANIKTRLIIGADFMSNTHKGIFEFYCLLMTRFRETERHPEHGASYRDVDQMTDEEREQFNKQPVTGKNHE